LLEYLQKERGYEVMETKPGIYTMGGDVLPIQIINSRRLPIETNPWLRCLSDDLDPVEADYLIDEVARLDKSESISVYWETMMKANTDVMQAAIKRKDSSTIEKINQLYQNNGT
jgi:hypothetical protein